GEPPRQVGRTRDAWRFGVVDRDSLLAGGAVAAFIRRSLRPTHDKLTGALSPSAPLFRPIHRHCPAAVVARRHDVRVRDGHLAGATHRQAAWTGDTWRVGSVERSGLGASGAVAALIHCPVSPADDKLSGVIALTKHILVTAY